MDIDFGCNQPYIFLTKSKIVIDCVISWLVIFHSTEEKKEKSIEIEYDTVAEKEYSVLLLSSPVGLLRKHSCFKYNQTECECERKSKKESGAIK